MWPKLACNLLCENSSRILYLFFKDTPTQSHFLWPSGLIEAHLLVCCSFFFFFSELDFELRASHVPSRHSVPWAMLPVLFTNYFGVRVLSFAQISLDPNPPIYGMTGMHHYDQLFSHWSGVLQTFPPNWPGMLFFLISTSSIVWDVSPQYHTQLWVEIGSLWTFCLGWPGTSILLTSAS